MKRILVAVERRRPLICFEVFFGTIRPLFLTKKVLRLLNLIKYNLKIKWDTIDKRQWGHKT